jgi:hypothetical protein
MGRAWNIEHADLVRKAQRDSRAAKRQVANDQLPAALRDAEFVAQKAQEFREGLRRRTKKSPERDDRIRLALDKIQEAMAPVRAAQGRYQYGLAPEEYRRRTNAVSRALQRERHYLQRMLT